MRDEIKELAADNVLMSAYLILQDIKQLKRSLSLELDLARDRGVAQERDFQEFMAELRDTLTGIQANFRLDAILLNLVSPKAGDEGWQERNSSHSRLLDGFAKRGN